MPDPKPLEPWQVDDASRLDALFKERATMSQLSFGQTYEIGNQSAVSQYLKGRRPLNIDAARKFAKGLGVLIEDFSPTLAARVAAAAGVSNSVEAAPDSEHVAIPLKKVRIRAGVAGFSLDQTGDGTMGALYVSKTWLNKRGYIAERLFATRVGGMSMWPRIDEGDIVLINTADTGRRNGHVYGFNHEGQFVLKRLKKQLNRWYLTSDNPDKNEYPPTHADEGTFMIGRAVLLQAEEI